MDNMMMDQVSIICSILIGIYLGILPLAILLTILRERMGIRSNDAPNRFLGILFHFITVWWITPVYFVLMIIYVIKKLICKEMK